MSDQILHECGIAMIRLRKPLSYYIEKYGPTYAMNKMYILMEKQHNRGQDGVGIGCTKLQMPLGQPYMFRARSSETDSLPRIFREQLSEFDRLVAAKLIDPADGTSVKMHFEFGGECLMGHLRYGTSGEFGVTSLHPYVRRSNWPTKSLMVLGNFNMTNTAELNDILAARA